MIATKSIGQAGTREVGLGRSTREQWSIYRAIKSQPWPGSAAVHVALIWVGKIAGQEQAVLDGIIVPQIGSSLTRPSRVIGEPQELKTFSGQVSVGCQVSGKGFLLEPAEASKLISIDENNAKVVFPYLINDEVNNRPDQSAKRWAVDFNDISEEDARQYADVFAILEEKVRPVRQRKKPDGSYQLRTPYRNAGGTMKRSAQRCVRPSPAMTASS
ncbi:hypothetical protein ID871_26155 [Streptomyces pratensis]|nr:hypothetical protein [Streptomyces pratensis]